MLTPSQLATLRTQAEAFFQEPIQIYNPTIAYTTYGQQIVTSGFVASGLGYIGKLSGKDLELVKGSNNNGKVNENVGMQHEDFATVLFPLGTELQNVYIIRAQNKDWRVVWSNAYTNDPYKLYEKAICALYEVDVQKRRI